MTPHIFPGLKPPTSPLFFSLQAFIADNGGRLRLADILECESVYAPYRRDNRHYNHASPPNVRRWTFTETQLVDNIPDWRIKEITGRSLDAIRQKRQRQRRKRK